jgi:hypothetical protein
MGDDNCSICIIDVLTKERDVIYTSEYEILQLACSTLFDAVAFVTETGDIYTINMDGTGLNKIDTENCFAWSVDWSIQDMLAYSGIGSGEGLLAPIRKNDAPKIKSC